MPVGTQKCENLHAHTLADTRTCTRTGPVARTRTRTGPDGLQKRFWLCRGGDTDFPHESAGPVHEK